MIKKTNKTTSFLLPFYSNFGQDFVSVFEKMINKDVSNIKLFISDTNYSNSFLDINDFIIENVIFVQITEKLFNFEKHLLYLQSHPNYITNYEEENENTIIVFKLNEPFESALKDLKLNLFSKMYNKELINKFFGSTKDWYLIFIKDNFITRFNIFEKNKMCNINDLTEKWDKLDTTDFFNNIILSPFHILNKSENLKLLLEHIYKSNIPKENELITKINFKEEILNYENKN